MSKTNETKELIEEALYREMYGSCAYTEGTGGELDTSSLLATYYASDRNQPASKRGTSGGAYMEIFTDEDCAVPHLCCNADSATPMMLAAAAEFIDEYPLSYWEDIAREKWEKDCREADDEREWKDGMMRDYDDELRSYWR